MARGGYERVSDHGAAIRDGLGKLVAEGCLGSREELDAVGFKTVLGHRLSGCREADEAVLEDLGKAAPLAPAHNPAYIAGIRQFAEAAPGAVRVALFETAFYQWVAPEAKRYGVPGSWHEAGVRRNGFHGASHKFVAERSAELLGRPDVAERVRRLYHEGGGKGPLDPARPLRVVSCHLGGSSSVTGMRDGVAAGTSMGMTPQSGLPQGNRVGDLDAMAVPFALREMGLSLEEVERQLTRESGLLGMSGVSHDVRDLTEAAGGGHAGARLALDALAHSTRHWVGAMAFVLGGLDALVFAGGIGENNPGIRAAVCAGLEEFGIRLDAGRNDGCRGAEECLSSDSSRVRIWVMPANEELVVARETARFLEHRRVSEHAT